METKALLEAILFVAENPVPVTELAEVIEENSTIQGRPGRNQSGND